MVWIGPSVRLFLLFWVLNFKAQNGPGMNLSSKALFDTYAYL